MGELINFPLYNWTDIPEALRQLANKIESGNVSARRIVICIEETTGGTDYKAFGEDLSYYYAVGICQSVIHDMLQQFWKPRE